MSVQAAERLKSLQTRESKIRASLEEEKERQRDNAENLQTLRRRLSSVQSQIEEIRDSAKELVITEHALLRYLERVRGINLDRVRQEMIDERTKEAINKLGTGTYSMTSPEGKQFRLRVKDRVVATAYLTDR